MSIATWSAPAPRVETPATNVSPVSPPTAASAPPASAIDQASIDSVAVTLTVYLGPIAKMVASREARRAANFDEFVQRVEDCITDAAQRRRFRRDLDSSR
jgi:serine/threonine-protein kinase